MKILNYIRCPVCGKLSRAGNFDVEHKIGMKKQEVGGRGHIRWFDAVLSVSDYNTLCERLISRLNITIERLSASCVAESVSYPISYLRASVGGFKNLSANRFNVTKIKNIKIKNL
jgi:hypothetical protein